jgi:hypothetical protein
MTIAAGRRETASSSTSGWSSLLFRRGAILFAALALGVLAAHIATTPTASASYGYDHLGAFAQSSERTGTGAKARAGFASLVGVAAEDGGGLLARLRSINWRDETGAIRFGRAPEYYGGRLTQDQAMEAAAEWLGPGYREVSPGRFISANGERVVRYGAHETRGAVEHIHFEAIENGHVVENTRADIAP